MNNPSQVMQHPTWWNSPWVVGIVVFVMMGALLYLFWDGALTTWSSWQAEQYSHGPMIPLVAAFLFLQRVPQLGALPVSGRWLGSVLVALGLAGWVLGELSSIYTILQYAFLLAFYGLVIALLGWPRSKCVWAALVYLLFMIPLPNFIYANLSQQLQLVSSSLGVAVIRWCDISVFLEGNVIDLGVYKLQVVEACSGLNYLFPLMSFGFLLAYLFRAPVWQRCIVFLSTAPITILMNSLRIGVIGVLVEYYGIGMASGFLHWFEGWLIFLLCVAVLLIEIKLFTVLFKGGANNQDGQIGLVGALDLSWPGSVLLRQSFKKLMQGSLPLGLCAVLLLAFIPVAMALKERIETPLPRNEFVSFPLVYKDWAGRQGSIAGEVLQVLNLTDHFIADYREVPGGLPVNLYVAFYASQRKGASVHSPRSCIPGGGWEIQSVEQRNLAGAGRGAVLRVNRVIIQKGDNRLLVYYWFQQRGRVITNEYLAKWYIFWDALVRNRTDGALVRVTVPVMGVDGLPVAEAQLQRFVADFYPLLGQYIPD
ncbi:MAG: VPLPA-CTERM-specific exosortase XrtD [Gammaproteobacteria bacterium]|nr:MAG: VPLPA-CTERM-specific exosortase XrtD [Gammaproteobacteria bacterium]